MLLLLLLLLLLLALGFFPVLKQLGMFALVVVLLLLLRYRRLGVGLGGGGLEFVTTGSCFRHTLFGWLGSSSSVTSVR